jgi:histidinol-phosphate phosphatase family protein
MIPLQAIDHHWTLFLDRDGVINHEKEADYVRRPEEFRLYEGVIDAMAVFSQVFGRILIVTNQKGIGKGLMTEQDLADIHAYFRGLVEPAGGRIDRIYHCPDLDEQSPNRKPNPGMGYQAKQDFPDIDFHRSLMVGNTMGDMAFGKALGAMTVFIPSTKPMPLLPHPQVDAVYDNLPALAKALQKSRMLRN